MKQKCLIEEWRKIEAMNVSQLPVTREIQQQGLEEYYPEDTSKEFLKAPKDQRIYVYHILNYYNSLWSGTGLFVLQN